MISNMNRSSWLVLAWFISTLYTAHGAAAELGVASTFSSDTEGWTGFQPFQVPDGGPDGEGDGFLQVESQGGNGPGSRLATFTEASTFIGSLSLAGATSLDVDIKNFATTATPLDMRLSLFGPGSTGNRWTSATPVVVPNDGQWHSVSFPINSDAIVRVSGSASFDQMLDDVVRLMLRHDASMPSSTGTSITATVGFDNIVLRGASGPAEDLNADGVIDVRDIDLLLGAVQSQSTEMKFDLSGDGLINDQDILALVESPTGLNTYIGDANLDGEFSSSDLVAVFQTAEYEDSQPLNSSWATGDWNGDREFGTGDLLFAFQRGGFEQGPRASMVAAAVPEPSTYGMLGAIAILLMSAARRTVPLLNGTCS
jgi:hypothetical protein